MSENNWNRFINWFTFRPKITGFLLFLILSIAIVVVSIQHNQIETKKEYDEMENILSNIHQNIEQSLKNCYATTVSLALTLDNNGNPQYFDSISKQLINSNSLVNAVQLVPNGIIKYMYPLKGNEKAINLNILDGKNIKIEALKSIETQKIYFAGPLILRQGGIGIVGRLPITHKNKFWGFAAVIIKLETLLKIAGVNSIDSKYDFQFSKKDPITSKEHFFLSPNTDLSKKYFISQTVNDSDWRLYLIAKKHYLLYPIVLFRAIIWFIVAIFLGIFTTKLLKNPEKLRQQVKEQETKFLKNEMKFKSFFDKATIGFAIVDIKDGNLLEANKKFYEIFGYNFNEIKSLGLFNLTHPDYLQISLLNKQKLKEGKIREYTLDKQCVTKTGRIIWINLTVAPLWESNEEPNSYIAFINDITERKKNEELITKSQNQYKSLIDDIDGIVWEYDIEKNSSTFVSKKIESILGFTQEEYSESPTFWDDHIYPEDRKCAVSLSLKSNKKHTNHDLEYRMITKNGQIVWIRDIINYVYENGKAVIARGIVIDITKVKEAEKDLNNTLKLVTEQNKRLLNFSYIVSHNLRSHTSNIESIISLIELSESEQERIEMMQLLKTVSISLDETMKHLNEVVNINTNMSLTIKPLNLHLYINKAKEVLKEQIELTSTTFITNIPLNATINYNSAYLESIFYNLISNAIRYKHPDRSPVIKIQTYKEKGKDVIEISDNGIGIDLLKNRDKIFGMYKTFSNNPDARGIGLFITKNQVDAMGGTLTLDSTPNEGSTFKIYT